MFNYRGRQDFGTGAPRGSGAGASQMPETSKIFKIFPKKIAKMDYSSLFFNKVLKSPALIIRTFWRKTQNLEKI